nr:30S ribosomal protein S6 [uncultured Desulfobulbus sp.]
MRHYETTYILRPNLGEDQFTEIIDRTNAIITDDAGAVIILDRWGMKRLAYEIKKEVQGYYVYLNYAATAEVVDEIERIFRIDDRVLRYLTLKLADAMDAEGIEAEKQRIADKAAAIERAAAEAEEGDDIDDDDSSDDNDE